MGQRHQIFVIARIQGRYRCIAAFHSQWLYARMVVKAAARLIRAVVNPINAAIIASELAMLERLDTSVIARKGRSNDYENPDVLCPYLSGLVLTCYRVDMEEGRLYKLNLARMHVRPSRHDNDDGYTCFDLSDATRPKYCFWWPGTGPLTAYQYLEYASEYAEKYKQLDASVYGIFGHFALLDRDTLADAWPRDFRRLRKTKPNRGKEPQRAADRPSSVGFLRSAASAIEAIRTTNPDVHSEAMRAELWSLVTVLSMRRSLESADDDLEGIPSDATPGPSDSPDTAMIIFEPPSPELQSYYSQLREMLQGIPDRDKDAAIEFMIQSLNPRESLLQSLRAELLASPTLDNHGILRLKQLIADEEDDFVDLKPWLSTGALDAAMLLDFSDVLQHAQCLDLSFSFTLTAEILETLVRCLPNVRHIIAFGCDKLVSLSTALPLTSYLASLPTLDAIDQIRLVESSTISAPECLRWVEASDPPAGLTVVIHAPPLLIHLTSLAPERYGLELSHFGAEGVVRGFARYLERLYQPHYRPTQSGCYFEMRAYFHSTGSLPLRKCIPTSHHYSQSYSFGCLPSLIRFPSPEGGHAYPSLQRSSASGAVTSVPRHAGWVLMLDTKGTMPYHRNMVLNPIIDIWSFFSAEFEDDFSPRPPETSRGGTDGISSQGPIDDASSLPPDDQSGPNGASTLAPPLNAAGPQESRDNTSTPTRPTGVPLPAADETVVRPPDESSTSPQSATSSASSPPPNSEAPQPEYAFERWDVAPGQKTKELRVVERVSVREWVSRLPAGHGPVPETLLADCEAVLARLNVVLRGSPDEPVATD